MLKKEINNIELSIENPYEIQLVNIPAGSYRLRIIHQSRAVFDRPRSLFFTFDIPGLTPQEIRDLLGLKDISAQNGVFAYAGGGEEKAGFYVQEVELNVTKPIESLITNIKTFLSDINIFIESFGLFSLLVGSKQNVSKKDFIDTKVNLNKKINQIDISKQSILEYSFPKESQFKKLQQENGDLYKILQKLKEDKEELEKKLSTNLSVVKEQDGELDWQRYDISEVSEIKISIASQYKNIKNTVEGKSAVLLIKLYDQDLKEIDAGILGDVSFSKALGNYYKYIPNTDNKLKQIYSFYRQEEMYYLDLVAVGFNLKKTESVELGSVHVCFFKDKAEGSYDDMHELYQAYLKDTHSCNTVLYNYFVKNNISETFNYINRLCAEKNLLITDHQKLLINFGKKLSDENMKGLDCLCAEKAVNLLKNTMAVRAAFWSYQRAGDIKKSKECLNWLEKTAEKNKDSKLKDFVKLRKNSYLFLTKEHILELLKQADDFNNPDYIPNSKTIAYILHNSLPFASGGYATRGHGLAVALTQKDYVVEVINRPGFPLDTKPELVEAEVLNPDIIDGVRYSRIPHPRRDKLATYDYLVQASKALYERFLELKPSIVIAASNHLTAIPALIAARRLKLPFYYEVRGFWEVTRISREPEFEFTEWYKLLCEFEALSAQEAKHVFTLTTPMAEELIKRGVDKDKITILPNSCNPDSFIPRERDEKLAKHLKIPSRVPVIGYIGTFVQYEGLDHLAEACGLLKEKGIEFRLLIVGNENTAGTDKGPITQSILDIAKKFNFEDWLIMPGRIPHEEVESYYSLIDIAPFPRKPQPVTEMVSPMKPLEAAAMKKAIIASSVKALVDMIDDGKTGIIFEKGNVQDFSCKLELLLKNEYLRSTLGSYARKWVEDERTWSITSSNAIKVLTKGNDNLL